MLTSSRNRRRSDRARVAGTRGWGAVAVTLSLVAAACGGANATGEPASMERLRTQLREDTRETQSEPIEGGPTAEGSGPVAVSDGAGPGQIRRSELDATLAEGPGRFLQGVVTEPHREDGSFVGFRLVSFYPGDPRFESVDLRRGDVIRRVNGTFIERPEQLVEVWEALGSAGELVIDYFRDGAARTLSFSIVD